MALIRGLNMHMKTIRSVMYSGLVGLTVIAAMSAQALQTVDPKLSLAGASINGSTQAVPAGTTFTVYGVYSDDSANPESGLGLKVKYNGTHLTGVTISEEYTKCRIAVADVQNPTTATAQAVMGWIDTAIRPNGVVASATGAVGWPDLADLASGGCLNPGSINTDTAAVAASGLKLFKLTGTMAPSCTSAAACTSTITFDSEGNYSYANAGAGFTNKSFTIQGAPAPTCNLDVDGDGLVLAAKDGILIQRALNPNVSDANVVAGITITGPRNTGALIRQYLNTFMTGVGTAANIGPSVLDVDGNSSTTSAVDGVAIKRALNVNVSAANVVAGLALASGTTGQSIRQYLNTTCGLSLPTN